jgi:DNA-binding XRE family transcriptional regulator
MRKASARSRHYRGTGSSNAERLARFRQQMADVARGDLIRRLREDRHLSQEDAAHEIGVSVKTIRAWEKGGGILWPNAKRAGRFYGVEPETLVSREDGESIEVEIASDKLDDRLDRLEAKVDRLVDALNSEEPAPVAAPDEP